MAMAPDIKYLTARQKEGIKTRHDFNGSFES